MELDEEEKAALPLLRIATGAAVLSLAASLLSHFLHGYLSVGGILLGGILGVFLVSIAGLFCGFAAAFSVKGGRRWQAAFSMVVILAAPALADFGGPLFWLD